MKNKYLISIYYKNRFIGYVKNFRKQRSLYYRVDKTKNINKSIVYNCLSDCERTCIKLGVLIDSFNRKKYSFEVTPITKQEIRKSKLNYLKIIKPKYGLFKTKLKI